MDHTDQTNSGPSQGADGHGAGKRGLVFWLATISIVLVGLFISLSLFGVLPAVFFKGQAEQRELARSNAKELGRAIKSHSKTFVRLPSNRIAEDGTPLLSWRWELLSFAGNGMLADSIDYTKSWKDQDMVIMKDQVAAKMRVPNMQSPRGKNQEDPITHFVCVTDEASPMASGKTKLTDVEARDGAGGTAIFLEYHDSDIEWIEPRDITLQQAIAAIQSSDAPGGTVVGMADGRAILVPKSASKEDLEKLFLLDNGVPNADWIK